jgi:hypothetical protein
MRVSARWAAATMFTPAAALVCLSLLAPGARGATVITDVML